MSHFNEFSAIGRFDLDESRAFWSQIITNPDEAILEGTSSHIEIRHFSSYLMSADDYRDTEKDLQIKRYTVDPFKVTISGTQWSSLHGRYSFPRYYSDDSIALSVSANRAVASIDTKSNNNLAPLEVALIESQKQIAFWSSADEHAHASKAVVPLIIARIPLKTVESIWAQKEVLNPISRHRSKVPVTRLQCTDCKTN